MTITDHRSHLHATSIADAAEAIGVVLYGDFTCPWSYLAYRRLAALRVAGLGFEFRAVEHDPWRAHETSRSEQFAEVQREMDTVLGCLRPDEELPYTLAGFVPHTKAAVSGYAEAAAAGVADVAAPLLFEAFWRHGLDLSDPRVVRTLLADAIMGGSSSSDPLRRWGHAVDVTGGPMTTAAWRLVREWRGEWTSLGKEVVPVLVPHDEPPVFGVDAVQHAGELMGEWAVDPSTPLEWPQPGPRQPVDGFSRRQVLYLPPVARAR